MILELNEKKDLQMNTLKSVYDARIQKLFADFNAKIENEMKLKTAMQFAFQMEKQLNQKLEAEIEFIKKRENELYQ